MMKYMNFYEVRVQYSGVIVVKENRNIVKTLNACIDQWDV